MGFFALTLVCFALTVGLLRLIKPKQDIVVLELKYIPVDLMNYTLPYIVSFMSIDYQDVGKFVGFVIFLGWMFWITMASGQIVLNPVLIALGWRLYEIKYRFTAATDVHIGRGLINGHFDLGDAKQFQMQDIQIIRQGA
jgi:hypothetical protein